MKEISLAELATDTALTGYLCHKSGEVLHHPGEIFSRVQRALLHQCGIDTVIVTEKTDSEEFKKNLRYRKVLLEDIPVGEPVPVTLYDSEHTPVLKEMEPFSEALHSKLTAGGVQELLCERDDMELELLQVQHYRQLLESDKAESLELVADIDVLLSEEPPDDTPEPVEAAAENLSDDSIPEERFIHNPSKQITPAFIKQVMGQPELLCVTAEKTGPAPRRVLTERTAEEKKEFANAYARWVSLLEAVFTQLKSNKETDFKNIETIAREIIDFYFRDCFYCLNLMNGRHPPASDKYLLMHSVNVAIASVAAGIAVGCSRPQVRELAVGALLHDIGHQMTYRPLMVKRELDSSEQHKYDHHTVVGVAMLKNITKVPLSTMLVVAQHHERCNGTGRIYHASAKQLHDFSRLVSVADTFETTCRFTKTSAAMALTIRSAQDGELDVQYLKALLSVLSLYPIGTPLQLKSGMIAKVIGTNGEAFKTPLLRSVYTMTDDHLFPIDSHEVIDLNTAKEVTLLGEVQHSALKSDIANGF